MLGKVHQPVGVQADLFGQHAVDGAAQRRSRLFVVRAALEPALHENAADAVAWFHAGHARSATAITSPAPSESGVSGAFTARP